jgi:hypothetical protein
MPCKNRVKARLSVESISSVYAELNWLGPTVLVVVVVLVLVLVLG